MKSQTDISGNRFVCISRVVILIIGRLLILGIKIIMLVIGSFLEFRWFIIILFIDMAVDVMQSATFELNISDSLHGAQTNPAIANETKRTFIFANGNSLGGGGLALEPPKMHALGRLLLLGHHSLTAQFH